MFRLVRVSTQRAITTHVRKSTLLKCMLSTKLPDFPKPKFPSLVEMLEFQSKDLADKPLFGTKVGDKFNWLSYRDFGTDVAKFRTVLTGLGLQKNDKVEFLCRCKS